MEYTHDENCTCPGCLSWDPFDNIYIDFAMQYSQQMLTYTLARELFFNFPMNMPPHILMPIMAKRYEILTQEMQRRGVEPELLFDADEAMVREIAYISLTPEQHRIRCAFEGVYGLARFGKKIPEFEFPQFERILISQNIVVICSFAEGFFSNTIRFLCSVRSKPLTIWEKRRGRKVAGMSSSQKVDQFVFEMGYGSIDKKIERIETEFDFQISSSQSEREKVAELFLMRDCIVHNAGLVSKAYKESGMAPKHLNVGDEMDLQEQPVEDLIDTLVDVVIAVYRSVSLQILKKPADRLMYGAHRNITS
jgi:hypothetical protein